MHVALSCTSSACRDHAGFLNEALLSECFHDESHLISTNTEWQTSCSGKTRTTTGLRTHDQVGKQICTSGVLTGRSVKASSGHSEGPV